MKGRCNNISNTSIYPEYYFLIAKEFITTDISTIKIYNKKDKKYTLNFPIIFFIFALLICVLQCYNNGDSFRSCNYKNNLKNVLNLGFKRSLAESNDRKIQTNEEFKFCKQESLKKTNLESRKEESGIKKNIYLEEGNDIETIEKSEKVKFNERVSKMCINNLKLILSSFTFPLSLISLILSIKFIGNIDSILGPLAYLLINLSIVIHLILLIQEKIEKKRKNKL
ncbi:fam-h protein [Plasmodium relictum]|uniref:Fam-h protein n=1 Tax=Plasmodium relictum TaxID=85471 RepID=A0A1J1GP90_PLARL|nr:fam-h protein [Plasmodium relictum]CRG85256.1 fam-h protein [Plasmodium relictum]